MLKECKVLLNNKAVTVIQYGEEKVQIPAIGFEARTVFVKDDGHYTVVFDNNCEEKPVDTRVGKKSRKKKPTVQENAFEAVHE